MSLDRYKKWFYAAAIYNALWGALTILFPRLLFVLIAMPPPNNLPLWQVVGMLVGVYAPAYWWAARRPDRHAHIILIAFIGKAAGPIGFLYGYLTGQLPLAFGLVNLTNDLIWLPAFWLYLREAARLHGGWGEFVQG